MPTLIDEYDLSIALYEARDDIDLSLETTYPVTNGINLYGVPNVIEITNETELSAIRSGLSGKYILLNDITLTSTTLDDTEGWNPIGGIYGIHDVSPFSGIFNGNGYKVSGLWIDRSATSYIGLFGSTEGAQIKNLGIAIDNAKGGIKGYNSVGAVAGYAINASSIKNAYSNGTASGDNNVGGIAGFLYNSSLIANSYSTGNVSGTDQVGGIAGMLHDSSIKNAYSTGNVSGTDQVGGIAGNVVNASSINNGAAINPEIASVDSEVSRVAGIISGAGTLSNNFALVDMTINGVVYDGATNDLNGSSKSIGDLKIQSTYSDAVSGDGLGGLGWKFGNDDDNPWRIDSSKNDGLPYLYWRE